MTSLSDTIAAAGVTWSMSQPATTAERDKAYMIRKDLSRILSYELLSTLQAMGVSKLIEENKVQVCRDTDVKVAVTKALFGGPTPPRDVFVFADRRDWQVYILELNDQFKAIVTEARRALIRFDRTSVHFRSRSSIDLSGYSLDYVIVVDPEIIQLPQYAPAQVPPNAQQMITEYGAVFEPITSTALTAFKNRVLEREIATLEFDSLQERAA